MVEASQGEGDSLSPGRQYNVLFTVILLQTAK